MIKKNKIYTKEEQNILTGRSAITWPIALQAAAVAPVCTEFIDTSIKKKNTAGIGSRTCGWDRHAITLCYWTQLPSSTNRCSHIILAIQSIKFLNSKHDINYKNHQLLQ